MILLVYSTWSCTLSCGGCNAKSPDPHHHAPCSGIKKILLFFFFSSSHFGNTEAILQSPNSRTPNPGFNPGFNPPFYITNAGMNSGLNPGFGVLRCGLWYTDCTIFFYSKRLRDYFLSFFSRIFSTVVLHPSPLIPTPIPG
jgi:hypothetical protein